MLTEEETNELEGCLRQIGCIACPWTRLDGPALVVGWTDRTTGSREQIRAIGRPDDLRRLAIESVARRYLCS